MGYKISSIPEFQSRFVSGDEINGKHVPATIDRVEKEEVSKKPGSTDTEEIYVVYFEGKQRGVTLNKTRANELVRVTGSDDTDNWKGKQVVMYTQRQKAFGDWHNVIHFKASGEIPDSDKSGEMFPQQEEDLPTINAYAE